MKDQRKYYVERIKQLEKRKLYLKTNFFDDKIAEYKSKLDELEKNKPTQSQ